MEKAQEQVENNAVNGSNDETTTPFHEELQIDRSGRPSLSNGSDSADSPLPGIEFLPGAKEELAKIGNIITIEGLLNGISMKDAEEFANLMKLRTSVDPEHRMTMAIREMLENFFPLITKENPGHSGGSGGGTYGDKSGIKGGSENRSDHGKGGGSGSNGGKG